MPDGPLEPVRPVRLQLSRRRGFDLQALSRATNGLPAANVARPSKWGNPFKVGVHGSLAECIELYRRGFIAAREAWIGGPLSYFAPMQAHVYAAWESVGSHLAVVGLEGDLGEIAGKNLACWCQIGEPCHADVLLDFANPACSRPPRIAQERG